MIRCLIVDDEQHAIDILVHYVNQTSYLELVGSTTRPVEALQTVVTQKIDLVFFIPSLTYVCTKLFRFMGRIY